MKKNILYIPLLLLGLGVSSCGNWLDINTDPNASVKVSPGYLFNYSAVTWSGTRCGGDLYIPITTAAQVTSDGLFDGGWDSSNYIFDPYTAGNTWVGGYANGLQNLNKAIDFAKEEDNPNAIAQCKILQAEIYYSLTVMFGDIPYSQALLIEEYPTPAYDSQETVLNGIVSMLDEAIGLIKLDNNHRITDYDIYYKGDMEKWLRLAKSMKLRTLMLMVDKVPAKADEMTSLLNEGQFLADEEDNFTFPYYNVAGTKNPNYALLEQFYPGFPYDPICWPHKSAVEPMVTMNDPRVPVMFSPDKDGNYIGLGTQEEAQLDDDLNALSTSMKPTFHVATTPDVLFSYEESEFMLAEIYARGLGVTADLAKADEHYRNGVRAACAFVKVNEADIETYVESLPELNTLTPEKALEAINIQVWIACMDRPLQAWTNQRRSNVPALQVPSGANAPSLFARFQYPDRERNVNPNVPSPLPEVYDKMWFQK